MLRVGMLLVGTLASPSLGYHAANSLCRANGEAQQSRLMRLTAASYWQQVWRRLSRCAGIIARYAVRTLRSFLLEKSPGRKHAIGKAPALP